MGRPEETVISTGANDGSTLPGREPSRVTRPRRYRRLRAERSFPVAQCASRNRLSAVPRAVPADTFGTTHGGPVETVILTGVPAARRVPGAGLTPETYPERTRRFAARLIFPTA